MNVYERPDLAGDADTYVCSVLHNTDHEQV